MRGLTLNDLLDYIYWRGDLTFEQDVFDKKFSTQKIASQGKERIKIYEEQKFPYEVKKVTI